MTGEGVALATRAEPEVDTTTSQPSGRSFVAWGVATYLLVTAAVLATLLLRTGGRLIYVIDDPAIHLSLAENLVDHGTWGVVPGHFESASSSPLWTLLLAGWITVIPGSGTAAPLVLNLLAGVAVIAVLGLNQRLLRPGRDRPFDALAVAALVVVVLFLPGLAVTGMEHSVHLALVLPSVVLFHRRVTGQPPWGPAWLPHVLLALATLARFETIFVALSIGLAMLAVPTGTAAAEVSLRAKVRQSVVVVASSGLPLASFALFNRSMGQSFLPNSVVAKTGVSGAESTLVDGTAGRLTADPLLAVLLALFLMCLLFAWQVGRPRFAASWGFPALTFVVAFPLHVAFARIGWYERYQAYLVLLGVYALLALLTEVAPLLVDNPETPPLLAPGIVVVLMLFSWTKLSLTAVAPEAAEETYLQRYQAGVFLDRYYDRQPIATGELGYVSLAHDGPLTDLFGLGDHEVLEERRRTGQDPSPEYWNDLARRRGFDVVAAYPTTLFLDTPEEWILVGTWEIDEDVVTAWEPDFQFWATEPGAVTPLMDNLREFERELPEGVTMDFNEFAELQAAERAGD